MNKSEPRVVLRAQGRTFSRNDVLKLLSLGGIVAVAGYGLSEYVPWIDYDAKADEPRQVLPKGSAVLPEMPGIIRYATLAASGHNTQPWMFALRPNEIEIHPDYSRRLPAVDPGDRELWISLGCALENLLITARATGHAAEVTYPEAVDFIHIKLTTDVPEGGALFDAIPLRQNTRSEYDGRPVKSADLVSVRNMALESGVGLHFADSHSELTTLSDYVHQAASSQYADQAFLKELIRWLRFDKKEALASFDGLYSPCTGNPSVPRWLGQMFVTGAKPQDQADADVKKLRSSAGAVIVTSASDGKADWVRTGQVYQRMALKMTSLNIKSAFLNQPIEMESVRSQLQSSMDLGTAQPQLLVRFGYANPMPRSLRRPVAQVLMQS